MKSSLISGLLTGLAALICTGCSSSSTSTATAAGGPSCTYTTVALNQQVANPITMLSSNANGLTLQFPYLSTTYGNTVTGYAVLGVATQANNTPATSLNIPTGTTFSTLNADPNISDTCYTDFQTTWNSTNICGFIDSGSESLLFPNSTSSPITYDSNSSDQTYLFYTPVSSTSYSATNISYGGSPIVSTPFNLENVDANFSSYNVFSQWGIVDTGGVLSGEFDWGLPFFLGRTVFIGLEGATSSLGNGIYWSYPTTLNTSALTAPIGNNVMPVTIGGYGNEPIVSVTVCVPGTATCTTIPNILLDTGSSGLRIFSSSFPSGFTSQLSSTGVGECISYGDNSVQWGSVQIADVQLGQQTASSVPIHIINTGYGDGGAACYSNLASLYYQDGFVNTGCPSSTTAAQSNTPGNAYFGCPFFDSPATYYNGILGVNFLAQDCGPTCAQNLTLQYYSCQ